MTMKDELKRALPGVESDEGMWNAFSGGMALVAGIATRTLVKEAWKKLTGNEPPANPAARDVGWADAIAWTAALSVAVGTARLLAKRGAATVWEKNAGDTPPM